MSLTIRRTWARQSAVHFNGKKVLPVYILIMSMLLQPHFYNVLSCQSDLWCHVQLWACMWNSGNKETLIGVMLTSDDELVISSSPAPGLTLS